MLYIYWASNLLGVKMHVNWQVPTTVALYDGNTEV